MKIGKEKVQKHILNDNLAVLYKKLLFKHPGLKVSMGTFKRYRQCNVLPVSYGRRNVCLCQRHQNFALRLVSLKAVGITQSPGEFLKEVTQQHVCEQIDAIETTTVKFRTWKQVTIPFKEKHIKRTTLVDQEETKEEFKANFLGELILFRKHHERVLVQHENFAKLKEVITASEATVQLDFAENYVCSFQNEVSGAYYSKVQVTVHPLVAHYKSDEGTLQQKTVVVLSDETSHKAATV